MSNDEVVGRLVITSQRVLKAFREGRNPTFDQLEKLEGALFPFLNYKICGHNLLESCDCEELNNAR